MISHLNEQNKTRARPGSNAAVGANDHLVCGIDPELDCDQCRAARAVADRRFHRRELRTKRHRRRRQAVRHLAAAAGVSVQELRAALLALLARPLGKLLAELQEGGGA